MNMHAAEFLRELPHNIEAERQLLGALMMNNSVFDLLPAALEPRHFFLPHHQDIFSAMVDLRKAGRGVLPSTIKPLISLDMIEHEGETVIPAMYLARLATSVVSLTSVPDFIHAVLEASARRATFSLGGRMEEAAFSTDFDILDEVDAIRARFEDVMSALSGPQRGRTLADAARRALESTANAVSGSGAVGVDYGLRWLMDMVGPFLPGQEIIIGGGTKQGKSTLIEQITAGAAMNGHPVWINSGEMKGEELAHRALSRLTDIQAWRQIRGKVSDREYEQLDTARRHAETWQDRVFIRDDNMTLAQIQREIGNFSKRNPGGLAIVDHIGLVERDRTQGRMSDAEFAPVVTKALKMTAGEANLPIVAAAQLKKNTFAIEDRKLDRKSYLAAISRRPKFGDIFGSVEKDANHVIIPFRAEPILQELEPAEGSDLHAVWEEVMATVRDRAEIVLALSRHTSWPKRREVGWDGPKTMFVDLQQGAQGRML